MTIDGGFRGFGATREELEAVLGRLDAAFERVRAARGRLSVSLVQELQARYDAIRGQWAAETRGEQELTPAQRDELIADAQDLLRTIRRLVGGPARTAVKVTLFSLGAAALFGGGMFLILSISDSSKES